MAFYRIQKDKILIHIKVNPGKLCNKITGIKNDELCLDIKAPPEKGRANMEVVKFLAGELDIPRTGIEIKSGQTNRHKTVLLPAGIMGKLEKITGIM